MCTVCIVYYVYTYVEYRSEAQKCDTYFLTLDKQFIIVLYKVYVYFS